MQDNIPVDRQILMKWLRAGYVENRITYPTRKGTPQGIISPTLANMTLDGLEQVVHQAVPRRSRVNFVRYADDFIVTGKSRRILQDNVKPVIEKFLSERGLELSPEKTEITYIREGFTFPGQTFCKHGNTLHITPSKEGVLALMQKVKTIIDKYRHAPVPALIKHLNQTLRGWGNYHRWVISSRAFRHVDNYVFNQLWRMVRRKHRNKSKRWLYRKYWTAAKGNRSFSTVSKEEDKIRIYQVTKLSEIGIKRYVKVRAHANPYSPEFGSYFYKRRHDKKAKVALTWGDVNNRVTRKG